MLHKPFCQHFNQAVCDAKAYYWKYLEANKNIEEFIRILSICQVAEVRCREEYNVLDYHQCKVKECIAHSDKDEYIIVFRFQNRLELSIIVYLS